MRQNRVWWFASCCLVVLSSCRGRRTPVALGLAILLVAPGAGTAQEAARPSAAPAVRAATAPSDPTNAQSAGQKGVEEGLFPASIKIPGTDVSLAIGGYVKVDFIQDFKAMGNVYDFQTNTIPAEGTAAALQSGQTTIHARETRFNLEVRSDSPAGKFRAFVEGDFFGSGNAFRLRHGFGEIGPLLGGQTWTTFIQLVQYHFHGPSEHTVGGKHVPMEMHLVHKSADAKLAVVAAFIAEGAHNTAFDPVWANLPAQKGVETHFPAVKVDVDALLPATRTSYRYDGSLTTPPCSEGVKWIVMTTPIQLSSEQVGAFTRLIKANNRPVQALNGRTVLTDAVSMASAGR